MDLSNMTSSNSLKVVFVLHFLLSSWGVQGYWSPDSYFYYNAILLILIAWTIHSKDSAEPVQLCLAVNVVSILLDIIVLGVYFPSSSNSNEKFSAVMAIMNLIARPITSIVFGKHASLRLGLDGTSDFSNMFSGLFSFFNKSRVETQNNEESRNSNLC